MLLHLTPIPEEIHSHLTTSHITHSFIHSRFIKLPQGALHCARYWRKNNKWDTLLGLREHESREFQHYSHLCFMFLIFESHLSKMPTPPSWCRWTNWTCHPWLWAKSEIKCVSLSWSHKISCLPTPPPPSHHLGPSKAFYVETWASHGPSLSVSRYNIFLPSFFFGFQGHSSPTRDQTRAPGSENTKS